MRFESERPKPCRRLHDAPTRKGETFVSLRAGVNPAPTQGNGAAERAALRRQTQRRAGLNGGATKNEKAPPFAQNAPFLRQGEQDGAPAKCASCGFSLR